MSEMMNDGSDKQSELQSSEPGQILELLARGPKAPWDIRRYLQVVYCCDSRAATTWGQLATLVAAGLVARGEDGLYYRRHETTAGATNFFPDLGSSLNDDLKFNELF